MAKRTVTKLCERCHRPFEVPCARKDTARYCSKKCPAAVNHRAASPDTIFKCTECGVPVRAANFPRSRTGRRARRCGACAGREPDAYKAAMRRHYEANKETVKERSRAWAKANEAKNKARQQQWRTANPERVRASRVAAQERDPEWAAKERARGKIYRQTHKEQLRATGHRARARRMQAEGSWTKTEWDALCAFYGNRCLGCLKTGVRLHVDHVVPLRKGGTNYIWNLQPLCHSCNSRKHVSTIDFRDPSTRGKAEQIFRRRNMRKTLEPISI